MNKKIEIKNVHHERRSLPNQHESNQCFPLEIPPWVDYWKGNVINKSMLFNAIELGGTECKQSSVLSAQFPRAILFSAPPLFLCQL
jgi:hypothetical protein